MVYTDPALQAEIMGQVNNPSNPLTYVPPAQPTSNLLGEIGDDNNVLPSNTAQGIGATPASNSPTTDPNSPSFIAAPTPVVNSRMNASNALPIEQPPTIDKIVPGPPPGYTGNRTIKEHMETVPNPDYKKPAPANTIPNPPEMNNTPPGSPGFSGPIPGSGGKNAPQTIGGLAGTQSLGQQYLSNLDKSNRPLLASMDERDKTAKSVQDMTFGWDEHHVGQFGTPDSIIHHPGSLEHINDMEKQREAEDLKKQADNDNAIKNAQMDWNIRKINLDREAQEVRDTKIDPQKWFKDRGVAGSMLAAISVGLGQFAAGVPHNGNNTNAAMDIVNKSIEREVDAQKANIENQWKSVQFHGTQDERQFAKDQFILNKMNETRITAWNHWGNMVDTARQGVSDQMKKVDLANLRTEGEAQKATVEQNALKQRYDVLTKEAAARAAAANAGKVSRSQIAAVAKELSLQKGAVPFEGINPHTGRAWTLDETSNSRAETLLTGGNSFGSGGGAPSNQSADKGLLAVADTGKDAAKSASGWSGVWSNVVSQLPGSSYYATSNTSQSKKVDTYNDNYLPGLFRQVGERMPPEQLHSLIESLKLDVGASLEFNQSQVDAAIRALKTYYSMPKKNTGTAPADEE